MTESESQVEPTAQDKTVPVVEEKIQIEKEQTQEKVRVSKQVREVEVEVDEPGFIEEIEVERIPMNRVLDGPLSSYQDGDTFVIPVVEERVDVVKRLVLVEEVRVKRIRKEVHDPQRVALRREEVVVDRDNS